MARTYRADDSRRRPVYRTEAKPARKATNRATRHAVNELLTTRVDHDEAAYPRNPSTGGWNTH